MESGKSTLLILYLFSSKFYFMSWCVLWFYSTFVFSFVKLDWQTQQEGFFEVSCFFFTSAPCFSLVDGWVSTVAAEFIFFVFSFLCLYIWHLLVGLFLWFFSLSFFCVFCLCRLVGWRVSTAAAKFIDQTFLSPSSCYQIKELRHRYHHIIVVYEKTFLDQICIMRTQYCRIWKHFRPHNIDIFENDWKPF